MTAEMTRPSPPDADGRFTDWRQCGIGATATVYRVRDQQLGCDVAIKILNPMRLSDPELLPSMLEGMRNEVRISRSLRHRYICPVHEIYDGPFGTGVIMDFISGGDLRAWMDRNHGRLSATADQRLGLLRKLAVALSVAHAGVMGRGIAHRDLKPANIILVDGDINAPMIMDFGCSAFIEGGNGMFGCTPKYMAPEQLDALLSGNTEVDSRADLFAFGVIAYELLTDLVPPTSLQDVERTRVAPNISLADVTPPSRFSPRLPAALDHLILCLMEAKPDDRVQSAEQVREILNRITLTDPSDLSAEGRPETVEIPACRFVLGSKPSRSKNRDELPGRTIQLSGFAIDATPVTNDGYRKFVEQTGYPAPPLIDDPMFGRPDHPVVAVTHGEAEAYARWAGGFLPSEAQWECAAKAGTSGDFPWGNDAVTPLRANIDGLGRTTMPVRAFIAGRNALGLWDMCGNVWEWCADIYDEAFYKSLAPGALDPTRRGTTGDRVLRGGGFQSFASQGRCAFRGSAPPDARRDEIGFRVAYRGAE